MILSSREKQLIWRGLCASEEEEKERIAHHLSGNSKFNERAKQKMISTSKKRLEEIKALKDKLLSIEKVFIN